MTKKRITLIVVGGLSFIILCILAAVVFYKSNLAAVNPNDSEPIEFVIEKGTSTGNVITNLKDAGLIKSDLVMKVYARLHPGNLQSGKYRFSRSMSAEEIYARIIKGDVVRDTITLTFIEGKRIAHYAEVIASKTNYTEEEVVQFVDSKDFVNEMIEKYYIVTEDVLNSKIYHPLEGYLCPDTYEFEKDATLHTIIDTLVRTMNDRVSKYKDEIESSKYSIHEIITLASIVDLEGKGEDRANVSIVLYNRLKYGDTLGCDATTYYAVGKELADGLTWNDLNSCNAYNTRGSCVKGLPAGPIANPSSASITYAINPPDTDYYYFVSDNTGKSYFGEKSDVNFVSKMVKELTLKGLWY